MYLHFWLGCRLLKGWFGFPQYCSNIINLIALAALIQSQNLIHN
jgi:hypothetical protein